MVTIAYEFALEVRVHMHLANLNARIPAILSVDSMRRRYIVAAMHVDSDEHEAPERITFRDGSIAERDDIDKRVWREVEDDQQD